MRHAMPRVGALSSIPLLLANRAAPPTATTGTATTVTATSATLNGTISANGSSTTVEFEYGTSSGSYTSTATAAQSPVTGDSVAVSASITLPGVTTYYRVKATNSAGTVYGAEQKVSTLTANLVAYWKLDETSGTRSDSVGGNDLTDNGSVGSTIGVQGNAADFDGTNYLEDTSFPTATGSIVSIAGWAYLGNTSDAMLFLAHYNSALPYPGYGLGLNVGVGNAGTQKIVVWVGDAVSNWQPSTITVSASTWIHVAATITSTTTKLYLNGSLDRTISQTATISYAGLLRLGENPQGTSALFGALDGWGIWDRVLTDSEVTALYNSSTGLDYPFI